MPRVQIGSESRLHAQQQRAASKLDEQVAAILRGEHDTNEGHAKSGHRNPHCPVCAEQRPPAVRAVKSRPEMSAAKAAAKSEERMKRETKRDAVQREETEGVVFVDELPAARRGRRERGEEPWESALRARPGKWARVETCAKAGRAGQRASFLRRSLRALGFEVVARGSDVFARFIGDPK